MAAFRYMLGRFAFRRRGLVTLLWVLIVCGVGAAAAPAPPPDRSSMPGTESQKTFDLLEEKFPDSGTDGATARVVVHVPEGGTIEAEKAAIGALAGELGRAPQVSASPTRSRPARSARTAVPTTPW